MSLISLKEDLLQEFREERKMIDEQIGILDPLATSFRRPAAQRLLKSTTLVATEIACYLLAAAGITIAGYFNYSYPFKVLLSVFSYGGPGNGLPDGDTLTSGLYLMTLIASVVVFFCGRMARAIRQKNAILNKAGRDIRKIVGQHLERKAAIDSIEQRQMLLPGILPIDKPKESAPLIQPGEKVNEVANPGFE